MRSILRLAATRPASGQRIAQNLRLASSTAAAAPVEPPLAAQASSGDPGPSTVRNAKAQRRRLRAELQSFSESAKSASLDLETFNDILTGAAPALRRRVAHVPTSTIDQEAPTRAERRRIKPTLADSPFALSRRGEQVVFGEADEIREHAPSQSRYSKAVRGPRRMSRLEEEGGRTRWANSAPHADETEPFKRIKDGPYALAARIKRWIEAHPSPLSSTQVEELIGMVTDSPKGDVNSAVWGSVFAVLGRERKLDRMWRAYNDMKKSGIKPSSRTYTTLLNAYASVAHPESPVKVEGIAAPPEARTLSRVAIIYRASQDHISHLRPAGDPQAESGLSYPQRSEMEDDNDEMGLQPTNAYLKFLARYGMYAEAEAVFQTMLEEEGNMGPDVVTFASMFTALSNAHARQEQARNAVKREKTTRNLAPRQSPPPPPSDVPVGDTSSREFPPGQRRDAPKWRGRRPSTDHEPPYERRQRPLRDSAHAGTKIRRQPDSQMGRFQHRPKVGFGLMKPSDHGGHEARTYTTDATAAPPVSDVSTTVNIQTIIAHAKKAGRTTPPQKMPSNESAPLEGSWTGNPMAGFANAFKQNDSPRRESPEHRSAWKSAQARRTYPQDNGRSASPGYHRSFDESTGRKPRHRATANRRDEGPTGRGGTSPLLSPMDASADIAATVPPPSSLAIGEKARWLFQQALTRLAPRPTNNGSSKGHIDQGIGTMAIVCLLKGRPEDQRYALALIPRLFDLPPLPGVTAAGDSAAESTETLPMDLPTLSLTPSGATMLIGALTRANRPTLATHYATVFLTPGRWKRPLDAPFYGTMMRALANTGDVHAILDILEPRPASKFKPAGKWPMYAYCEALTAARWAGDWEAAKKAWGWMEQEYGLPLASESAPGKSGVTTPRVGAKAMTLLLKVALGKGKKDVSEAMEIYNRYGDSYDFGGRMSAGRKDALVSLTRKMRQKPAPARDATGETSSATPDEGQEKTGGSAWVQELRVDLARARELLSPHPRASASSR